MNKTCYCVWVYEDEAMSDFIEENWFFDKEDAEQYKKDWEGKYFWEEEQTQEVYFSVARNEHIVETCETYLEAVFEIAKRLVADEQNINPERDGDTTPEYFIAVRVD